MDLRPPVAWISLEYLFIWLLQVLDAGCGIFSFITGTQLCVIQLPDQGLNLVPLHWALGVLPLDH